MPEYRFVRQWEDMGRIFKVGEVISLSVDAVHQMKRIKCYGETCDLCPYGYWRVPFTFLAEMKMNITFYDRTEEMLDDLGQAMQAADEKVQPWQAQIKKGDYFWQDTEYGFQIYGEILKNAYREKHLKNYRFCRCYSEACTEGELGDIHVSIVADLLTRAEFEEKIKAL